MCFGSPKPIPQSTPLQTPRIQTLPTSAAPPPSPAATTIERADFVPSDGASSLLSLNRFGVNSLRIPLIQK